MATDEQRFIDTRFGGFVAGLGIGIGIFLAVRFGPQLLIGAVLAKAPRFIGGKIASFVLEDVSIGRVALVEPGVPLTIKTLIGSGLTVGWYMFGGFDTVRDAFKSFVGIPITGTGEPHEQDPPTRYLDSLVWVINSDDGRLQVRMPNMSRVDP